MPRKQGPAVRRMSPCLPTWTHQCDNMLAIYVLSYAAMIQQCEELSSLRGVRTEEEFRSAVLEDANGAAAAAYRQWVREVRL